MFTIMQLQVLHHSQQDQPQLVAMVSTKELVDQVATHYIHSLQAKPWHAIIYTHLGVGK